MVLAANRGMLAVDQGDPTARVRLREAEALGRAGGAVLVVGHALMTLGQLDVAEGALTRAEAQLLQAHEMLGTSALAQAGAAAALGEVRARRGDAEGSAGWLDRARRGLMEFGEPGRAARWWCHHGQACLALGDRAGAALALAQADALLSGSGDQGGLREVARLRRTLQSE